jgi:hypothetical protein
MTVPKIPFEERVPLVLKIINEAKKPIMYGEIHAKLITETGVKISKHTLNKCLSYMEFDNQITKTKVKGKAGNPVLYSIPELLHPCDTFSGDIAAFSQLYEQSKTENDTDFMESTHHIDITQKIQYLLRKLIEELHLYSTTKQRHEAGNRYDMFLRAQILPSLRVLKNLVKSPIMSDYTYKMLLKAFNNGPRDIMEKEVLDRINRRYSPTRP